MVRRDQSPTIVAIVVPEQRPLIARTSARHIAGEPTVIETDPLSLNKVEEKHQLGAVSYMDYGNGIDMLFDKAVWRRVDRQTEDKREHFPAPAAPE